jgi:2Fe-2S ferredoxin
LRRHRKEVSEVPKVLFIDACGQQHPLEVSIGQSLMQAAVNDGLPGILADCGGNGACGTCYVHVDERWTQRMPPPKACETELIECLDEARATSRLCCQIEMRQEYEGLVVRVPAKSS